jgi:hypothetical protein
MNRPAKPEKRDITVMVRYTLAEYEAIVEAAKGEQVAVHVRRASLASAPAPDFDPRIVEVTLRSPGGHVDGVVGVFTLSVAAGMIALRRAAGWIASYRIVDEQPKVGAELPDPVEQIEAAIVAATPIRRPFREEVMSRPPDLDETPTTKRKP